MSTLPSGKIWPLDIRVTFFAVYVDSEMLLCRQRNPHRNSQYIFRVFQRLLEKGFVLLSHNNLTVHFGRLHMHVIHYICLHIKIKINPVSKNLKKNLQLCLQYIYT